MRVRANIQVLGYQQRFLESQAQYSLFLGGFGSGKTESGLLRCMKFCFKYGKVFRENKLGVYTFGVYEPTYDLIKTILFGRFEAFLEKMGIGYKLNKSDKTLTIPELNAQIIFRSLEIPDKIIGYEHSDFWIDELDTLPKDKASLCWKKIVARNRQSKRIVDIQKELKTRKDKNFSETETQFDINEHNSGFVTTTPEGFGFCYDTFENIPERQKEKFQTFRGNTSENIFIDQSYVLDLLKQYPENLQKAYIEGYYVNLENDVVYYNFDRHINKINMDINSVFQTISGMERLLHIGMDFNVGKMSATIGVHNKNDDEVYILDEIANAFDTNDMIRILKERYPDYKIRVYPDAAGNQRKTVNASESDIYLLRKAGFEVSVGNTNPSIKDRVLAVNSLFKNGEGLSRLYINIDKCKELCECLEQQAYKNGMPDKTSGKDHLPDALGYFIYRLYPIRRQLFLSVNSGKN